LRDGGAIKFRREISRPRSFVRKLNDPQQAITEPAVFALNENSQSAEVARLQDPEPKPPEQRAERGQNTETKKRRPKPGRGIPKPVRDDHQQEAQQDRGNGRADREE
jgi:hypothetical protein